MKREHSCPSLFSLDVENAANNILVITMRLLKQYTKAQKLLNVLFRYLTITKPLPKVIADNSSSLWQSALLCSMNIPTSLSIIVVTVTLTIFWRPEWLGLK
jgi:hypothetical protein